MIVHPSEHLTPDERAYQMWAVHPTDIERMGFKDRQSFYKAHIVAATEQALDELGDYESYGKPCL